MKNLLMTCLFILTILLAWTKTTYASGHQDFEFCVDEVEKQYVEGEEYVNQHLVDELLKECAYEAEVEYVKNTNAIESN